MCVSSVICKKWSTVTTGNLIDDAQPSEAKIPPSFSCALTLSEFWYCEADISIIALVFADKQHTKVISVSDEVANCSEVKLNSMANENTKFINSLFLRNLIENQYGQKDVKIKSYTVEQPSENGNVYTRASINRIFVKYSSSTTKEDIISFVTKIKPTKGELSDEFKISGDFTKEVQIYKTVVPALGNILKKIGEKIDFVPKYYVALEQPIM